MTVTNAYDLKYGHTGEQVTDADPVNEINERARRITTMTIKDTVKRLERATTIAEAIDLLTPYADADDDRLYELLLALDHDYLIESAGRTYMGPVIHLSHRHRIYVLPSWQVIRFESRRIAETDALPFDNEGLPTLERKIARMMEHMFLSGDDTEEGIL